MVIGAKKPIFSREDDFGLVGQVTSPSNRFIDSVNLLVKTEDWSRQTHDYRVRRFLGGCSQCYLIVEGDPTVYYSKQGSLGPAIVSKVATSMPAMVALRRQEFDQQWGFQGWLGHV